MHPGETIAERFEIEWQAGLGAMGTVFRARDRHTGHPVALKVMKRGDDDARRAERFIREARVLSELCHPGIVRYVSHGTTRAGDPYMAMEWLEGEDLASRLKGGPLTVAAALQVIARAAEALGEAHAHGIVHRDVKPSNLFIVEGDVDRIKVLDFGVARLLQPVDITSTGVRIGTPAYMAPEQVRGTRDLDARADVFSLGCVLFASLTGRRPFEGEDEIAVFIKVLLEEPPRASELRPDLPDEIDAFVARLLAKDPAERPADGRTVAVEIAALAPAVRPEAPRPPRPRTVLTGKEQRLTSMLLVGPKGSFEPPTRTIVGGGTVVLGGLGALVRAYGGQLERLADGSLVVALTSPRGSATDQAAHAARCALELRAAVRGVPIALATGRGVVAGRRLVGEVVDRAVRMLKTATAPEAILLDEVSAGLLDLRFDVGGGDGGLVLRGERDQPDAERTLLGRPTPCVGRERELAMLESILAECAGDSVARAVLVTGAPGLGKSRLRHELLRRVNGRSDAIEVWIARADPMSAGAPLGLLAPVIRRAAGITEGDPADAQRRKLRARVARNVAPQAVQRVSEFLGELAGVPFPDADSVQLRTARLDAVLMGDQMLRAWLELCAAEAGERPLLLVLEDLHWGDLPTVKFVDAALRNLADKPILVLALARPEVHELFPRLFAGRGVTEIQLAELSRRSCERLVRAMLPVDDAHLVSRLCDLAAGNAFYLEELIRAVLVGQEALPSTVLAMMEARLAALPPDARRVLRAASVFGEVFWSRGVAALLGEEKLPRVLSLLAHLHDNELIQRRTERRFAGEEEHVFRHALVREAAYATLTDADRALGHRLAAEWLERAGEGRAAVLAEHLERGGEAGRAIGYYQQAAEQALGANDLEAAVARARRGAACGAHGEALGALHLTRAEAHGWRGELDEAERWSGAALLLLPRGSAAWWRAAGEVVVALGSLARYERLVALVDEMRRAGATGEGAERARVIASARSVAVLFSSGRYTLAQALFEEIDRSAEALDPAVAGAVHWALGWRATYRRDLAGALEHRAAAAASYELAGDLRGACQQRAMLGSVYNKVGCYAQAEEVLRAARRDAQHLATANVLALVNNNLGFALCSLGQLDEGLEVEGEAARAFKEIRNPRLEAASRTYSARFLAKAGRLAEAEAEAREAVALSSTTPPAQAQAQAMLSQILLAEGRAAEALAAAEEALRLLEALGGIDEGESLVRLSLAEALEANGKPEAAARAAKEAHDRLMARAAPIADPEVRKSFLETVPDNARTVTMAQRCSG